MVSRDVLARNDPMGMQIRYFWYDCMRLLGESLVMQ
jgi:hypothetical protein